MINKTENCTIDNPPQHTAFVKRLHLVVPLHDNWLSILEYLWPQTVSIRKSTTRAVFWRKDD